MPSLFQFELIHRSHIADDILRKEQRIVELMLEIKQALAGVGR